ncbi:MAG: hypothetical protein N3E36_03065 [Sulfolobales archaeon]|nr:hypothetical protein [Sulfolobales archaeon]MCX8198995.1 hypothetical protein [Sulfolobales archaeon]MDW8169974.1 hypothetical protein [Desulfurococcaceae archaeon]
MSNDFNLVITFEAGFENYRYVYSILLDVLGDFSVVDSAPSIILLRVEDPYRAIELFRKKSGEIRMIYRVIPIDSVVEPYVEDVAEESWRLADKKIPIGRTYRVTLSGRLYWKETGLPAHSLDAIRVIASNIDRPVSLKHPAYVVHVRSIKIYGRRRVASVTVTESSNILSIAAPISRNSNSYT